MFPGAKSFAQFTPEQIRMACYSTQASRACPGRKPAAEHVGENYTEIHCIGQRDSKYMPFDVNRAPLLNRGATRQFQDYHPHPLGDNIVNKALAANFKGGLTSSKGGNPCPMDGTSDAEDAYMGHIGQELIKAKSNNQKPGYVKTHTVCPPGELMEKKSHAHTNFQKPHAGFKSVPAVPPLSASAWMAGAPTDPPKKSAMKRMHNLEASRVVRNPSTPNLGMTPLPPVDGEIAGKPRNCYMEAGK